MSFTNLYYKRAVGTPKACYICSRPTTTVLATKDSVDFLYTCDSHLKDPGFASPIGESGDGAGGARKLGLSDEEIQKVKEEWEEKQRRKKEREKDEKEKEEKDKKDEKEKDKADDKDKKEKKPAPLAVASPLPVSSPAPHQRYTLHRDIFAMRLTIHRKRRQTAQAKEVAPRLPSAPRAPVAPSPGP